MSPYISLSQSQSSNPATDRRTHTRKLPHIARRGQAELAARQKQEEAEALARQKQEEAARKKAEAEAKKVAEAQRKKVRPPFWLCVGGGVVLVYELG